MTKHAVVIAGAGPTGLMLAAELALARVDVVIVERRADRALAGVRAGGLHARSLEVLDQRGVVERFVSEGQVHRAASLAHTPLDISDLPTRHNYMLGLSQNHIERILAAWVDELGVPIERERELTGFSEREGQLEIALSSGQTLRADYLVGCDGGRSLVRKLAGIEFPGWPASTSYLIAECQMRDLPPFGIHRDEKGTHALGRLDDGRVRAVLREEQVQSGQPSQEDLRRLLIALYGSDFGLDAVTWLSRFSDVSRQAARYRVGRVLLAGDAAHVHSPMGGQGLNTGLQDAVNLGWKLAQVVSGNSPERLLDTYHDERHPVGARVLKSTMALSALGRGDARTDALREQVTEMLALDEPRRRYASMMTGLDVHYAWGQGHALAGRRMPDLDVDTEAGARRVFSFLHPARPVLINFGDPSHLDIAAWASRVRWINARYDGAWELPVLGVVAAPTAVLIRPDGYVAWVGEGTDDGLSEALAAWFGQPE